MRPFSCPVCAQRIYFENTRCTACGTTVGYHPTAIRFFALFGRDDDRYDFCANHSHSGCNWLVEAGGASAYCLSCDLNELIPPIEDPDQRRRWADVEIAKRRLLYSVIALGVPIHPKRHDPTGLSFRILVNAEHGGQGDVVMGHANGVITIDATEADAHLREFRRAELDERYRTLLGHMRHETGHYFWERLLLLDGFAAVFRDLFGDERADYGEALTRYYRDGPPPDWAERFISAYATAHPWEDWAESFAHYLHIADGVETALKFAPEGVAQVPEIEPYGAGYFASTLSAWGGISLMMNAMNRSMGHHDFYPFIVNGEVARKLSFIHEWVVRLGAKSGPDGC